MSHGLGERLPGFIPMKFGYYKAEKLCAQCIKAQPSSFSAENFDIEMLALPLFIPASFIYLTYGWRFASILNDVDRETEDGVLAALPRLEYLASVQGLRETASRPESDPYHAEMQLSLAVLTSDRPWFDIAARQTQGIGIDADWERVLADRCQALIDIVSSDGFSAGQDRLLSSRDSVLALLSGKRRPGGIV